MVCCSRKHSSQVNCSEPEELDGPLKKRSCTDIPFLLFFIAFLGGMGYIGYLSFLTGDPYRFIYGVDSWGNTCNRQNAYIENATYSGRDTTDLKYQFYFDPYGLVTSKAGFSETTKVCVRSCPNTTLDTIEDMQGFYHSTGSNLCHYDIGPEDYFNGSATSEKCPNVPIPPTTALLSFCIPSVALDVSSAIVDSVGSLENIASTIGIVQPQCENSQGLIKNVASDVGKSWREILYLCAISIVVAFIITLLMRFFAAFVIWALVLACAFGCLAGAGYCWWTWYNYSSLLQNVLEEDQTDDDKKLVKDWLIYSSVVSAVGLVILLILLVMRKRIKLVVQLFTEAGKAVAKMPLLLLQPIWTMLAILISTGILLFVASYVMTAGQPTANENGRVTYEVDELFEYMRWYYLLGMLWIVQFMYAAQQLIIAGAVVKWYFTRDKSKLGSPIASSTKRMIVYHLGSVAFGSFIIAVIQLVRIILMVVQNKTKGQNNKLFKYIIKCLQCMTFCLEKIMKYINKNAYIMIAIYGTNFCRSAQKAFAVIVSNVLRVGAINSVGTFCLFLGKAGVVSIVVVIGMEMFRTTTELCYTFVPLVVAGIFAFAIAHCFMSVYGMAIDTIFMCFCEDCNRNDGVKSKYYMSRGLMEYVENSREALEALDKTENERKNNPGKMGSVVW